MQFVRPHITSGAIVARHTCSHLRRGYLSDERSHRPALAPYLDTAQDRQKRYSGTMTDSRRDLPRCLDRKHSTGPRAHHSSLLVLEGNSRASELFVAMLRTRNTDESCVSSNRSWYEGEALYCDRSHATGPLTVTIADGERSIAWTESPTSGEEDSNARPQPITSTQVRAAKLITAPECESNVQNRSMMATPPNELA
jgi:hypothetical protein